MADGSMAGRKLAFLVEYEDIPDEVESAEQIVVPFMAALRSITGVAVPTLITAFVDDAAEAMIRARQGEHDAP